MVIRVKMPIQVHSIVDCLALDCLDDRASDMFRGKCKRQSIRID